MSKKSETTSSGQSSDDDEKIDLSSKKDGDIVDTKQGKAKVQTRTRAVTEQKVRPQTQTRTVRVRRADGTFEDVQQTFTVMVPYTVTKTVTEKVLVLVKTGKVIQADSDKKSKAAATKTFGDKKPKLVFKSKGKVVDVKDAYSK